MILSDFHTFITMSLSYRTQLGACDFGTCRSALRRSCWCLNLDGEKNWGRTKRRMTISAILFQKKNTFPNLPQYLSHWLNRDALQSRKSHLCVFFIGLLVRKLLHKQVLVGSFLWIFVLFLFFSLDFFSLRLSEGQPQQPSRLSLTETSRCSPRRMKAVLYPMQVTSNNHRRKFRSQTSDNMDRWKAE